MLMIAGSNCITNVSTTNTGATSEEERLSNVTELNMKNLVEYKPDAQIIVTDEEHGTYNVIFSCLRCGQRHVFYRQKYCWECGAKFNWEEVIIHG